jgi:NAD(P)-dependent dehydrogenase (short-subunit alcohol dehydrogenase family)
MSFTLAGKVALVTGATGGGIGRGASFALAKRGAIVAVTGRDLAKTEGVAADIRAAGGRAEAFVCDVSQLASIEAVVAEVAGRLGRIDILLNNAVQAALGSLLDVTEEAFAACYETGPLATFRMMKACHPHLKAAGDGIIVNFMSSAAVRWDMSGYGVYGASKAMVRVLGRAAAAEWARDGIRVLTISPHAMSPGLKWWTENRPEEAAAFVKTIPMGRIGDPEKDIGEAIVALCQPEFAYLTGATIPLDGGQANLD